MSSAIEYNPPQAKITVDDIDQIRRYVKTGLILPIHLEGVLIYFKGGIEESGITSQELLTTFINIHYHAEKWAPLETELAKVAATLTRFADDLNDYTEPSIEEIKSLEGYKDYSLKTNGLNEDQIRMFRVPIENNSTTENTYATIEEYIKSLIHSIQQKQNEVTNVKYMLIDFEEKLNFIEADVGKKVRISSETKSIQELRDITTRLIAIQDELSLVNEGQNSNVGERFMYYTQEVFAPGININKIQALRDEANRLEARQTQLQIVTGTLNSVHSTMRSLGIFTRGALQGITQIETLWSATLNEIVASKNILAKTKDFSELTIFIIKMTAVLARWQKINTYMSDMKTAMGSRS